MDAKEETIKYVKKLAEYLEKNTDSLNFETKISFISDKLSCRYGIIDSLLDDKIIRYPYEAKSMATCFDSAVLHYLVLKELGYNCRFNEIKAIYNCDDGSSQKVHHSIVTIDYNGKNYLFDPAMRFEGECEIFGGKITLTNQEKYIDLESVVEYSENQLFEKLEYYQTPEGKASSLEQEFRVNSKGYNYSLISMQRTLTLRFSREKKAIENINYLDLKFLGKKKIIISEYLGSGFDIEFYDEFGKDYEKVFCLSQKDYAELNELLYNFLIKTKYEDYEKIKSYLNSLAPGDSEAAKEVRRILNEEIAQSLKERVNISSINLLEKIFSKEILDFFTFYSNPKKELNDFNARFRKLAKKYYNTHEFSKNFLKKCKASAYYENNEKINYCFKDFGRLLIDENKRVLEEILKLELKSSEFLLNEKEAPKELNKELDTNYVRHSYLKFFSEMKKDNYLDFDKYFGLYLVNEKINKMPPGEFDKLIENEDALEGYYKRVISMLGIYCLIERKDFAVYEKEKMKKILKEYYKC